MRLQGRKCVPPRLYLAPLRNTENYSDTALRSKDQHIICNITLFSFLLQFILAFYLYFKWGHFLIHACSLNICTWGKNEGHKLQPGAGWFPHVGPQNHNRLPSARAPPKKPSHTFQELLCHPEGRLCMNMADKSLVSQDSKWYPKWEWTIYIWKQGAFKSTKWN